MAVFRKATTNVSGTFLVDNPIYMVKAKLNSKTTPILRMLCLNLVQRVAALLLLCKLQVLRLVDEILIVIVVFINFPLDVFQVQPGRC